MEKQFFDYNILLNRTMNDPELAKEILNDFISETPDLILKLDNAIKNNDVSKIISISHELKGSSATITAAELAKQSKTIELQGRENNLTSSIDSIQELKLIYQKTVTIIQEEAL